MDRSEFNSWNVLKQEIESRLVTPLSYPKESEVWMCVWGKNIGYEQNGTGESFNRPSLVLRKFNNRMFLVVPLSTVQKDLDFYYNFSDPQNNEVSAILAQVRLMSVKRFRRKLYHLSKTSFNLLYEEFLKLLGASKIETPP